MSTFEETLGKTHIMRFPKHRLATFGDTRIQYYLVSEVMSNPARTRLRKGQVLAQKPKILTPEIFQERFEGFGPDASEFADLLQGRLRDSLRALEYKFKNDLTKTTLHNVAAPEMVERIKRNLERTDDLNTALLVGPESQWGLSVLKFIFTEVQKSFRSNIVELEEHNFFDPGARAMGMIRREIEKLFQTAKMDKRVYRVLASKLKEYGLFEDYQDRFFSLVR